MCVAKQNIFMYILSCVINLVTLFNWVLFFMAANFLSTIANDIWTENNWFQIYIYIYVYIYIYIYTIYIYI